MAHSDKRFSVGPPCHVSSDLWNRSQLLKYSSLRIGGAMKTVNYFHCSLGHGSTLPRRVPSPFQCIIIIKLRFKVFPFITVPLLSLMLCSQFRLSLLTYILYTGCYLPLWSIVIIIFATFIIFLPPLIPSMDVLLITNYHSLILFPSSAIPLLLSLLLV